jgi:hypothetical protein
VFIYRLTNMVLTEELLVEWIGLTGQELYIFYLAYKKQASNGLLHNDLEYIKEDILKFKTIYNKKINVKSLVTFWESKIHR